MTWNTPPPSTSRPTPTAYTHQLADLMFLITAQFVANSADRRPKLDTVNLHCYIRPTFPEYLGLYSI